MKHKKIVMGTKLQEYKKFIERYNIVKEKQEKLISKGNLIATKANEDIDKLQDEDRKLRIEEKQLVDSLINLNK